MYPHRIRLRGPWETESPDGVSGRLMLPATPEDVAEAGLSGRVRFRRRFGYPGRIDAHERVWLILDDLPCPAHVALNGLPMPELFPAGSHARDVTTTLQSRNELTIDLELGPERRLWGEVALEVRCLAYLRAVAVRCEGGLLHVTGEVVGPAVSPLDLYLVADRQTAAYAPIVPDPSGQPFALTAAAHDAEGRAVQRLTIDLVCGAIVWYNLEWPLTPQDAPPMGG